MGIEFMKNTISLLGLLLVLALTGCGSANKTKEADKTKDTKVTNREEL